MVYTLRFFFPSQCRLFHNSNVFGSCIIHIYVQGGLKLKKNNSGAKRLIKPLTPNDPYRGRTAPITSKVGFYIFIQQI